MAGADNEEKHSRAKAGRKDDHRYGAEYAEHDSGDLLPCTFFLDLSVLIFCDLSRFIIQNARLSTKELPRFHV